jgi:hypothetical protein
MTATSAETAEHRPRGAVVALAPPLVLVAPPTPALSERALVAPPAVHPACGRAALRAERQLARRERRRWALLGLSIPAATLAATVAILSMAH